MTRRVYRKLKTTKACKWTFGAPKVSTTTGQMSKLQVILGHSKAQASSGKTKTHLLEKKNLWITDSRNKQHTQCQHPVR